MTSFSSTRPSLTVDGRSRPDLQDALGSLVVNLPLSGMAHAELELTNVGLRPGGTSPDFVFQDIDLGAAVEIRVGDADSGETVFSGEVTGIEERYGDGAPRLYLLLQDKLHRLARSRRSRMYEDQSPNDILQSIASEAGLSADASVSSDTATYHQLNESDLAFLLRLTGRFDCALRLSGDVILARPEEQDPSPIALDAQDSALKVRILADLNHQPLQSRVLGFNAGAGEVVDASADSLRNPPAGATAANKLGELGWDGNEIVPQPFARTHGEAQAFAEGHFRRLARRFVSGDLQCLGEPSLRSGREIELTGVSSRLRGTYQVSHCVHRFDGSRGYETHIKVHRGGLEA